MWPLYVAGCGLLVASLINRLTSRSVPRTENDCLCGVCVWEFDWNANNIADCHSKKFPPSTELGGIDPILFLSIYLLMCPIL